MSHGFELQAIHRSKNGGATIVRGTLWRPVGNSAGAELANVHAPFAVEGEVTRGPAGEVQAVRLAEPAPADLIEGRFSHRRRHAKYRRVWFVHPS